ncbi:hypothetical protein [Anaeroarcus burkinensis]|uniref:hypothetical protein n=1 Tax=Anaeroarcus burkinensis TaxID=82376 RepID=UPI0004162CBA|nr:hypothetical protein [Anaeroarcus burkinensis]
MERKYSFNREERYFCYLLINAIQAEPTIANTLFGLQLEKGNFEIYNEASVIRDYWSTLNGNDAKEKYLKTLCGMLGYDAEKLEAENFYKNKSKKVIVSPATYGKKDTQDNEELTNLRALFNMRQDIMIIIDNTLCFIEVKLESPINYDQLKRFVVLKNLTMDSSNRWAGIDNFKDIKEVKLFYIKKTADPFKKEDRSLQENLKIVGWDSIIEEVKPVLFSHYGIDIESFSVVKKLR